MNGHPEQEEVSRIILENLRDKLFLEGVTEDTNLVDSGKIDSAGFIRLFVVLEEEFDIEVTARDLSLDRFQSVRSISEFVIEKRRRSSASGSSVEAGRA
ncbi:MULTISPECIES: acyl carrier protein [unclassified Streptomyces]|uniref:acyl carrier protein n=1 Tax=unclassified Streptomyces TaxID=2593676 RepID=UPI0033BDDDD4|nr:acyl carrier protein [Streptomyces sp. NBC_01176]